METYTNDELLKIKEAVYKVSDALYMLKDIKEGMESERRWNGQADLAEAVSQLTEICDQGSLAYFFEKL